MPYGAGKQIEDSRYYKQPLASGILPGNKDDTIVSPPPGLDPITNNKNISLFEFVAPPFTKKH